MKTAAIETAATLTWTTTTQEYESTDWKTFEKKTVKLTRHVCQIVDFGITDDKGRAVGSAAEIEDRGDGFLEVSSLAMRAGSKFGAIPRASRVAITLEAAKLLAAKKIEESRKRAVKNWTK